MRIQFQDRIYFKELVACFVDREHRKAPPFMGIVVFFYQDEYLVIRNIENEGVGKPTVLAFVLQPPDFQGLAFNDFVQGVLDKADVPDTLHNATV